MAFGDHFYTTSQPEHDNAVRSLGYVADGTACFVLPPVLADRSPLFRLFNQNSGDHFYTTSSGERDNAVAQAGYTAPE